MTIPLRDYKPGTRTNRAVRRPFPFIRILLLAIVAFGIYRVIASKTVGGVKQPAKSVSHQVAQANPTGGWKIQVLNHGRRRFSAKVGDHPLDSLLAMLPAEPATRSLLQHVAEMVPQATLPFEFTYHDGAQGARPLLAKYSSGRLQMSLGRLDNVWLDMFTGCVWPGPCPRAPTQGELLPRDSVTDFKGRESLLGWDVFRGEIRDPISAILPGVVLSQGKGNDGRLQVRMLHGNGYESTYSGLASLSPQVRAGNRIEVGDEVGRMPAVPGSLLLMQVTHNGKVVPWRVLYKRAFPLDSVAFATFRDTLLDAPRTPESTL